VGATKDRDWKTGKVRDSRTVDTGARARRATPYVGPYGPPPATVARTTTAAELEISGDEYTYTVRGPGTGGFAPHPCRYIAGDEIRYAQDKRVLYVIDADTRECRAQVMRQERIPAPKEVK
jgi:hypothetical protein